MKILQLRSALVSKAVLPALEDQVIEERAAERRAGNQVLLLSQLVNSKDLSHVSHLPEQ